MTFAFFNTVNPVSSAGTTPRTESVNPVAPKPCAKADLNPSVALILPSLLSSL